MSKLKIAKEKVWKTADGKLVKDGHEDADILVARKGQQLREEQVASFETAEVNKFFENHNEPKKEAPKIIGDPEAAVGSGPAPRAKSKRKRIGGK